MEIAERPLVNGSYSNLSSFNSITFQGSDAAQAGTNSMQVIANHAHHRVRMYDPDTGNWLTHALDSGSNSSVYQDHCK